MKAAIKAKVIMPSQTTTATLVPLLAWIDSVISRVKVLNIGRPCSAHHLCRRRALSAPRRAEQEAEADCDREGGIGTVLDRLVDRFDKIFGNVAHRVGGLAPALLGVGNDIIDARSGPLPSRVTLVGQDGADLVRKPSEIVTQRLQILLDVRRSVGRGLADFAHAFAGVADALAQ